VREMSIGENYERNITLICSDISSFSRGTIARSLETAATAKGTPTAHRPSSILREPRKSKLSGDDGPPVVADCTYSQHVSENGRDTVTFANTTVCGPTVHSLWVGTTPLKPEGYGNHSRKFG
jgi:hypothetical protein